MTTAFCPGHLTCFFQPVRSYDPLSAGSRGVGIRLSKGATVTVEERNDQRIEITMDGEPSDAVITRLVIRMLSPERGFDVTVENQLPVSQGFGMSAAGAIAAGLCICQMAEMKKAEAYRAAHLAEIQGRGGLGDVAAIMSPCNVPARTVAGLPPLGKVVETGSATKLTLAVLGPPTDTRYVLRDRRRMETIINAGSAAMDRYLQSPSPRNLFRTSREFSHQAGVETPEVSYAFNFLDPGRAGMCMLGNSIFTADGVKDTMDRLGDGADVIGCASTDAEAKVIRKG